jgi:translation initiation factor IF-3
MMGVVNTRDAMRTAEDLGLDLVEISPNADPPVCKILDYGKYKYEQQKKAAEARKNQKTIDVKEVQIRPMIEEHDYQVKLRASRRFLEEGDKLKVILKFRGREMAHTQLGMDLVKRLIADIGEVGKVDYEPKMEGKQILLVMSPAVPK